MSIPTIKTELLTQGEELRLIAMLPSKYAMDRLVRSNLGLIHKICHRFPVKNAVCTYDDLFSAGVEGLMYGIKKFDSARGYRLSTYCYRWIQAFVGRYFQNHGKTIRIPVHMATTEMKVKKATEQLTRELGRTPTQAEITEVVDDAEKVDQILSAQCGSLNSYMDDTGEYGDLFGEDRREEIDYKMEVEMMIERLGDIVSPRDLNIFIHRNGLLGKSEHTLTEVAEYHSLTRARVHQICNQVFNEARAIAV